MKICEWNVTDSVSIAALDSQHQELFDIFNEVFNLMDQNAEDKAIVTALAKLVKCSEHHFAEEEAVMAKMHYPELASHRDLHEDLLKTMRGFHEEAQQKRALFVALRAANTGAAWLKNHIHTVDKKYTDYMKKHGFKF